MKISKRMLKNIFEDFPVDFVQEFLWDIPGKFLENFISRRIIGGGIPSAISRETILKIL